MKTLLSKQIMNFHADSFGIVHHARYLELMEEARWLYCRENGLMEPFHQRGIYHVIVNINIDYVNSARVGDQIVILTGLAKASQSRIVFKHKLIKDNNILVRADITNVYLNQANHCAISCTKMADFWDDLHKIQNTR